VYVVKCAERKRKREKKAQTNLLSSYCLSITSLSPCLSPLPTTLLKFRESYLNELDSERAFFFSSWYRSGFIFLQIGIRAISISTNYFQSDFNFNIGKVVDVRVAMVKG